MIVGPPSGVIVATGTKLPWATNTGHSEGVRDNGLRLRVLATLRPPTVDIYRRIPNAVVPHDVLHGGRHRMLAPGIVAWR